MLESIKTEFECNEALLEDFPASIYAIRRLERIHNRASGQTLDGEPIAAVNWCKGDAAQQRKIKNPQVSTAMEFLVRTDVP
jgi:hypothetical protein